MEKLRYGIIGIKGMGRLHCQFAQQNEKAELTALVDIDAASVRQHSEQLGVRGFTDYRVMLEADIVDAVSIATPHHLHSSIGLDCLKAGVHIFVEKPIANRVSEADAMVNLARMKNLKICVGHQYRTHRSSQAMKHLLDTGAIGKILRVLWTWTAFRAERYYTTKIWRESWSSAGGGVLMNQVSHDLDLLCWMVGKPEQVTALIGNQLHQAQIEDIFCANVLFANGALVSVQATINQPTGYSVRQIAGDKGMIVIQDVKSLTSDCEDQIVVGKYENDLPTAVAGKGGQPQTVWQPVKLPGGRPLWQKLLRPRTLWRRLGLLKQGPPHGTSVLMDSFIHAILDGGEPLVSGESALPALELINAIVLSALRRKTVDLPLDREEYDILFKELSSGTAKVPRFH